MISPTLPNTSARQTGQWLSLVAILVFTVIVMALAGCAFPGLNDQARQGEIGRFAQRNLWACASAVPDAAPILETVHKKPLDGKVIVIDPGHQRQANLEQEQIGPGSGTTKEKMTLGTHGVSTGVYEYELNLEVSIKLKRRLEQEGATVYMTRETHDVNTSCIERAQWANSKNPQLVLRIHADGGPTGTEHGFLTLVPQNNQWCAPIYAASMQAGKDVHAACLKATGAQDRGVVERGDLTGFNWSTVPVILVEMGYMTTPDEDELLQTDEYQAKLVEGMTEGTITFCQR